MPENFDLYERWQEPNSQENPLTSFQKALILSAFPEGTQIVEVRPARSWSFYPVLVKIRTINGLQPVYLRKDRKIGGVELEAELLPVLHKLGLPVPELLAGPVIDPDSQDSVPVTVISSLPGESLLKFSWEAKGNDAYIAMKLVLEGVRRLHGLTEALQKEPVARKIPSKTLTKELEEIQNRAGNWLEIKEFQRAIKRLESRLPQIEEPLIFSNGDYNPGNFLFTASNEAKLATADHSWGNPGSLERIPHKLTGFVDFSWACFEDPHIGFAKYWTYDWFPAGLIERYLYLNNLRPQEFAPRLALRCLWTLQREFEPRTISPAFNWYRENLLGLLRHAMAKL